MDPVRVSLAALPENASLGRPLLLRKALYDLGNCAISGQRAKYLQGTNADRLKLFGSAVLFL